MKMKIPSGAGTTTFKYDFSVDLRPPADFFTGIGGTISSSIIIPETADNTFNK